MLAVQEREEEVVITRNGRPAVRGCHSRACSASRPHLLAGVPARGPFRLDLPPHVAEVIRLLTSDVKRGVRAALRAQGASPELGEPLVGELEGFWKYRVRRFRIVSAVERRERVIRVFAVGYRRGIYDEAAGLARRRPRSPMSDD